MNKNKGFSLVELIVVVAIMAVLVGILAPAYLSYVEKTRKGTDEDSAEEVRRAVEIATADICVYEEVRDGNASVTCSDGDPIYSSVSGSQALSDALQDVFGDKAFNVKSKYYNGNTYDISITSNGGGTDSALSVRGCWSGHN